MSASHAMFYSHERFFLHIIKLTDSFVSNELPDSPDAFLISEPARIPRLWPQSVSESVLTIVGNVGYSISEERERWFSDILQKKNLLSNITLIAVCRMVDSERHRKQNLPLDIIRLTSIFTESSADILS
jgi:hypothetical protein